jgi:hypothetical protein
MCWEGLKFSAILECSAYLKIRRPGYERLPAHLSRAAGRASKYWYD